MATKPEPLSPKEFNIGCASIISIIAVIVLITLVHQHFGDHAQALAYQAERIEINRKASAEATAQATRDVDEKLQRKRHEGDALRNHNRRLLWQKQHPAEYSAQLLKSRKLAVEREQQALVENRRVAAAQKAAEEAETRRSAELAATTERKRIAEANQPKVDELEKVQSDLTAEQIAGNPEKYVNSVMKLKCKVVNVVADLGANALCGSVGGDSSDFSALLLLKGGEVSSYDAGQVVQFLGTVQESTDGTNAMGGRRQFPTVQVDFDL